MKECSSLVEIISACSSLTENQAETKIGRECSSSRREKKGRRRKDRRKFSGWRLKLKIELFKVKSIANADIY